MATWVERAQQIIGGVLDGLPTAPQQQQNIGNRAIQYRPDLLEQIAADPANPTNEEKAEVFVTAVRQRALSWLRVAAEAEARAGNEGAVTAAGDAAVADL